MARLVPRAGLLLLILLGACSESPPSRTVLLLTIDTLRADHVGAFGYDLDTTPSLDALAARGAAFLAAWSQHPETGPSFSSLMSSRLPRETGVRSNGDVLPKDLPVLAEAFAAAGYETAAFVSAYVLKPHVAGLDRGFGHFDAEMTAANLGHPDVERPAAETADRAIGWLGRTAGRPRFLWVHFYDPHGKYDPGAEVAARFFRAIGRPPLDPIRIPKYQRYGDVLDPDDYVARYDGEIHRADRAAGRLLAAAGADAIVAFTADHGESLGEDDYWFRHGSLLHTPALRVPLVFAGPGVAAGSRIERPARNLDVAPTLLDLAGLPPLPGVRGRSLVPEWAEGGPPAEPPPPALAEARRAEEVGDATGVDVRYKVAATHEGLRLLRWPATGEERLFDLAADPGEARDVRADRPAEAARLRAALDEMLALPDRLASEEIDAEVEEALRGLGYTR